LLVIAGEGSKKKKKRKKRSAGPSSGLRMIDRDETGFAEEPKDYEQKVPSFEAFMDEGEEDGGKGFLLIRLNRNTAGTVWVGGASNWLCCWCAPSHKLD
jgi:hypothetical protein